MQNRISSYRQTTTRFAKKKRNENLKRPAHTSLPPSLSRWNTLCLKIGCLSVTNVLFMESVKKIIREPDCMLTSVSCKPAKTYPDLECSYGSDHLRLLCPNLRAAVAVFVVTEALSHRHIMLLHTLPLFFSPSPSLCRHTHQQQTQGLCAPMQSEARRRHA